MTAVSLMLAGAVLAFALAAGHAFVHLLRLPRITGFIVAGLVLGVGGIGLIDRTVLAQLSGVADIALGLVLYEVGRRLDLRWLARERWLLASSAAEASLSFLLVYTVLRHFEVEVVPAGVAAAIGVATSPAATLMAVRERRAKGPLTERILTLTALNNAFALLLVTLLLGLVQLERQDDWTAALVQPLYLAGGSVLLGYGAFLLARVFARALGKRAEPQLVMLAAILVSLVGAAAELGLSLPLALLAFGVFVKNCDAGHALVPLELGAAVQLVLVVLAVVSGAGLELSQLAVAGAAGAAFAGARLAGKLAGVCLFAPFSGLSQKKAALLAAGMMPMSATAVVMLHAAAAGHPEIDAALSAVVISAVVILELVGPLGAQWALAKAGETELEAAR